MPSADPGGGPCAALRCDGFTPCWPMYVAPKILASDLKNYDAHPVGNAGSSRNGDVSLTKKIRLDNRLGYDADIMISRPMRIAVELDSAANNLSIISDPRRRLTAGLLLLEVARREAGRVEQQQMAHKAIMALVQRLERERIAALREMA